MQQEEIILDAAAVLFYKKGFGYVSLKDIGDLAEVPEETVAEFFPNEALICTAWLEKVDDQSEKYHDSILMKNAPAKQKVDDYFYALSEFMKENLYRGCPFSNVASSTSSAQKEDDLQKIIVKHKRNLRAFLTSLSTDINPDNSTVLGDALFLLYSGATTESRNLRSLEPIYSAQKSAAVLCDTFS